MRYLLDTNVVSEVIKRRPAPEVRAWLEQAPASGLYLSVISLGELRQGVDAAPQGAWKDKLDHWLSAELPQDFAGRILDVDQAVAEQWGRLMAAAPQTPAVADALIAATALQHGLIVVTRNTPDFKFPGLRAINPWLAH
jgi:predicted nucleic acid-binding protein